MQEKRLNIFTIGAIFFVGEIAGAMAVYKNHIVNKNIFLSTIFLSAPIKPNPMHRNLFSW